MSTHEFVLIVEGLDLTRDEDLDRLYENGLDDATPSVIDTVQYLDVTREADSYGQALFRAQRQVLDAGGVVRHVLQVDETGAPRPGLVTLADIARRAGWTREYVRLLAAGKRGPGDFPPPFRDSSPALYSWAEVVDWLSRNLTAAEAAELFRDIEHEREVAGMTRLANVTLELERLEPELWERVRSPRRDVGALIRELRQAIEA